MKKFLLPGLIICMLLTITNCVTVTKGTEQLVTVNANVEDADVAVVE